MELNSSNILKNFGGLDKNNLIELFQLNNDNLFQIKKSLYYDINNMITFLENHKNELCVLSLNIKSIRSKFPQLQSLLRILSNKSYCFDAICIQETWLNENDNYHFFNSETGAFELCPCREFRVKQIK